jgi:hypothetical protein
MLAARHKYLLDVTLRRTLSNRVSRVPLSQPALEQLRRLLLRIATVRIMCVPHLLDAGVLLVEVPCGQQWPFGSDIRWPCAVEERLVKITFES